MFDEKKNDRLYAEGLAFAYFAAIENARKARNSLVADKDCPIRKKAGVVDACLKIVELLTRELEKEVIDLRDSAQKQKNEENR